MFSFTIKYLGFLKRLPLLPHFFDSLLKLWSLTFSPQLLNWIDEFEEEVLSWEDTSTSIHKFGGTQFNYKSREIGHIHGNGLLDVLLSVKVKQELMAEGKVKNHHIFKNSGWVSFYIQNSGDKMYALKLLRIGYNRILT